MIVPQHARGAAARSLAEVLSVTFQPHGKQIATGCEDTTLRVLDVATGNVIRWVSHGDVVRGAGRLACR